MNWIKLKTGKIINTNFIISVDLSFRENFYIDGEKHEYYTICYNTQDSKYIYEEYDNKQEAEARYNEVKKILAGEDIKTNKSKGGYTPVTIEENSAVYLGGMKLEAVECIIVESIDNKLSNVQITFDTDELCNKSKKFMIM